MEIKVKLDELKQNKLFVATPMYGGMAHGLYVKSCLDLQATMAKYGIDTKFSFLFNESLITRARNYLVDEFLRSECTHLLFLDSDIHYNPQDVLAMMALDKDVIGGQITGARSDLIILDDVVTTTNAHEWEKQLLWLQREVITRLGDAGKLLSSNT